MTQNTNRQDDVRPFARIAARELSQEEVATIAGGGLKKGGDHTHATGANGDDPGDPGDFI
jgi:hypothetical protein